jgi:hypothetical protein
MNAVAILAHQGGWDEILMVLGPIALMAGLLRLAKKRVEAKQAADPTRAEQAAPTTGPTTATTTTSAERSGPPPRH